ncbi:DUF2339 domain-containing protein [Rhodohalobacter mucosus]|uniref:DUF2339 domain-containing protein n=1 Tax=Rhodohalobacter mucosus TaxID=2079485 RepID=A0A316TU87_9BACT|nr:DUF2339 domain-containing protein [Rhodohalobacter mucosus]PWN05884.1 DUF2339 domain-containing protein [Rhodohalobacter mucosus]
MAYDDPKLNRLMERLRELEEKQNRFLDEIREIRTEIDRLSGAESSENVSLSERIAEKDQDKKEAEEPGRLTRRLVKAREGKETWVSRIKGITSDDMEAFIGENLISKIGIVITIIGVAIGARYAIDNDLISPLMRIVLGYVLGTALLLTSAKLQKTMTRFSAVLFSGSMAIFYIITFAAYSFYDLMPQAAAFILMVLITIAAVSVSVYLNMQPVAHIALVGAYAVPFLVGGEGTLSSFFLYMVIINTGVLITATYKYWKKLTYTAFLFTWLIVASWYWGDYESGADFGITITYTLIFFLIFYGSALAYKLLRVQEFERGDIWIILTNAFLFYAFGYAMMNGADLTGSWAGFFTTGNALIHAAAAVIVYRSGFSDRKLLWLISGLAITFFTLAIPVELEGSWVTLLWSAEAALLFTIGRQYKTGFYERMSHPVLFLAFFSLTISWENAYSLYRIEQMEDAFFPLLNIHFFTSLFFIACTGWIVWKDSVGPESFSGPYQNSAFNSLVSQLIRLLFIIALFFAFRLEISGYVHQLYAASMPPNNEDLLHFGTLWGYNYAMLFIGLLILAVADRVRRNDLSVLLFAAATVCAALFLVRGLEVLELLELSYLNAEVNFDYASGPFHIGIRYACFAFLAFMIIVTGRMSYRNYAQKNLNRVFEGLAALVLLWVLSDELTLWMDVSEAAQPDKLGLSILWGAYALAVIALGIRKEKKHLRIGAIALLGVTLIKLFFYDLADLDAIARTVVFVILGLLLLLASYLYNKYRKEL